MMENGFTKISIDVPLDLYDYCKEVAILKGVRNDPQSPGSPSVYNDVELAKFQIDIMPEIEKACGKRLYPTYTYFRMYNNGSKLDPHRDRPACEYSITLHLGGEGVWPICIQGKDNIDYSIPLKVNEGIVYKGCDNTHWRDAPTSDIKDYIQVFLHYVDRDGPHSNCIGDRR